MKHRPLALSFCIALLMVSSCAHVVSQEDEDYDYGTTTPTPDYDYNATFDYYYVTGLWLNHTNTKVTNSTDAEADGGGEAGEDGGETRGGRGRMAGKGRGGEAKNSQASAIDQLSPMLVLGLVVSQMWD